MPSIEVTFDKIIEDQQKLHEIIHGDDTAVVEIDSGSQPSIKKAIQDSLVDSNAAALAQLAADRVAVDEVKQLIDSSVALAEEHKDAAHDSETAAKASEDQSLNHAGTAGAAVQLLADAQGQIASNAANIAAAEDLKNEVEAANAAAILNVTSVQEAKDEVVLAKASIISATAAVEASTTSAGQYKSEAEAARNTSLGYRDEAQAAVVSINGVVIAVGDQKTLIDQAVVEVENDKNIIIAKADDVEAAKVIVVEKAAEVEAAGSVVAMARNSVLNQAAIEQGGGAVLNVKQGTLVTFAKGFNGAGQIDSVVNVGAGVTYTIPAGNENKTLYVYMNADGTLGHTDVPYLEGKSRKLSDTWGREGSDGFRDTVVHSKAQSATSTVTATSQHSASFNPWNAFDESADTAWVSDAYAFTNQGANHTRGYEALQIVLDTPRVINTLQPKERGVDACTPRDYILAASHNGAAWTTLLSVIDDDGVGVGLLRPALPVSNTTAWKYLELRITKANVSASNHIQIGALKLNTSAPKGDFSDIQKGIMYDETDTPIQRAYLATIKTDTDGSVASIENYPVARSTLMDVDVHGLLTTMQNRKWVDSGVVLKNNRYVVTNPFGDANWDNCDAEAWVLHEGEWMQPSFIVDSSNRSYGVKAYSTAEGLVVVTGSFGISASTGVFAGHSSSKILTGLGSAPCKVLVTYQGEARNA